MKLNSVVDITVFIAANNTLEGLSTEQFPLKRAQGMDFFTTFLQMNFSVIYAYVLVTKLTSTIFLSTPQKERITFLIFLPYLIHDYLLALY